MRRTRIEVQKNQSNLYLSLKFLPKYSSKYPAPKILGKLRSGHVNATKYIPPIRKKSNILLHAIQVLKL
jgi:hypothetical protein